MCVSVCVGRVCVSVCGCACGCVDVLKSACLYESVFVKDRGRES